VRLASADPAMSPAIDHGFLAEPETRSSSSAAWPSRTAGRDGAAAAPRPGRGDGRAERVRSTLAAILHPAETCALGAMVDRDLRVHGVENLYVGDASVMPSIPRANTHLTVLGIAEKLAAAP
jgi:choline dehydrogenase